MSIFDLGVLSRVVADLPAPAPFFLNSFFPTVQTEATPDIHFDVANATRRIAPFVSPIVGGKVVAGQGYQTQTFTPAYIKDKRVFDSSRAFKRSIGERIGGGMDPAARMQAAVVGELQDQLAMLTRRQELMAVETLRTGKVVIEGDMYPRVQVDFGRDAALTPAALTGTARWGESAGTPLKNLETWSMLVTEKSGATATTVIMDVKAWQYFSADPAVVTLLDRFRGAEKLDATVVGEGGRFMGTIGNFDIWVYVGWYAHPDTGALTPYLPDHTVIITSPEIEGVRVYGAIKDEEAGFQAVPYFTKSWVEPDPAVRYLLLQSAPLMVPYRVNASLCATVR